jgi:hypothetical protein
VPGKDLSQWISRFIFLLGFYSITKKNPHVLSDLYYIKKNGSAHDRARVNGLVMDPNLNPIYQMPLINITNIL